MSENEQNNQAYNAEPMSINKVAQTITRGSKIGGVIVAIIMIVLGILFMFRPFGTGIVLMAIATVGFVIYGVYQIILYVKTPHDARNGWTLANGIIFIVLGVLIMLGGPGDMMVTFAFILGFLAMFGGINQITAYAGLHKAKTPGAGWVLASGIINLIIGVFFLIAPFGTWLAFDYVLGIYLIVGGIAFLIEVLSGHAGRRAT